MTRTRTEDRATFTDAQRLVLLEQDMDRMEGHLLEIERKLDEGLEAQNKRLDRIQQVMIGILISVATGALLMAANLAVLRK